jgi:hypothetical protein
MSRPIAAALSIGLCLALHARASETTAEDSAGVTVDSALGATREFLRDTTEWVARRVDGWFGDKPFEQGGRVAGRVGLGALWRQDEGNDWLTRFAVRLDLPNIREAGFLFLGRDNEREVVSDRPEAFTRRQQLLQETREDQAFFAGLGAQVLDVVSLRAGLRSGVKPFVQARYRKDWDFGAHGSIEFRETVFWTLDDRFGSTTALNYGVELAPALVLRWQSAGTVAQESEGLEWASSVGLYRRFGDLRQLSLELLVNGQSGLDVDVGEYGWRARWEQPVHRDWLLGELILGHFWPRRNAISERGRAWAVGANLQLRF